MLDSQTRRLDRAADKLMPELRDLQKAQDGTEIKSRELELITDRARKLRDGVRRSSTVSSKRPANRRLLSTMRL